MPIVKYLIFVWYKTLTHDNFLKQFKPKRLFSLFIQSFEEKVPIPKVVLISTVIKWQFLDSCQVFNVNAKTVGNFSNVNKQTFEQEVTIKHARKSIK